MEIKVCFIFISISGFKSLCGHQVWQVGFTQVHQFTYIDKTNVTIRTNQHDKYNLL